MPVPSLNIFKKFFGEKNTSVLGVDIGTSSIKLVQLKKNHGQAVLETYGEIALGPYDNKEIGQSTNLPSEKIAEAINDLIRESSVTTRVSGVAIPFLSSLVSLIEMPLLDNRQLAQMIPIEARKYIPVPISEVLLDWSIVPKDNKEIEAIEGKGPTDGPATRVEKTDVMVVAIHNDTINKFQDVTTKTGLSTSFYEIEMFSTLRSVIDQNLAATMIMDVGSGSTKLYIVERGVIKNSHLITRGSQDITVAVQRSLNITFTEAEQMKRATNISQIGADQNVMAAVTTTLNYIFAETNQVLLNYAKKYNKTVSQIVMIGGGVLMQGFLPFAQQNFQIQVALGEPFSKVEAPAFLEEVLKTANPEFSVAVGVALRMLQELE